MKKIIREAFPHTIPVMLGYLFVGIAFGLLLQKSGYNFLWSFLMSIIIYAGSMQFVAINFLQGNFGLIEVALVTLFVNMRQIFYGLSFIDLFKTMGKKKTYMIFSLTDETYSLLCSTKAPTGTNDNLFFFCIALLNHSYWIIGSVIGSLVGSFITFNTKGIDFAMTALFIVIFVEQWLTYKTHIPALVGIGCTLISFLIFGPNNLILPSMILIALSLMALRRQVEEKLNIIDGEESNNGNQ